MMSRWESTKKELNFDVASSTKIFIETPQKGQQRDEDSKTHKIQNT